MLPAIRVIVVTFEQALVGEMRSAYGSIGLVFLLLFSVSHLSSEIFRNAEEYSTVVAHAGIYYIYTKICILYVDTCFGLVVGEEVSVRLVTSLFRICVVSVSRRRPPIVYFFTPLPSEQVLLGIIKAFRMDQALIFCRYDTP